MRLSSGLLLITAGLGLGAGPLTAGPACQGQNALSGEEKEAGWVLLFDGATLTGWHGYNGQPTPAWSVADCALHTAGTEGNLGSDQRADLVTDKTFTNFELSLEWKASKGGNSGVLYGVVESKKYKATWETGPEYQLIDDVGFPEKLEAWQKAGSDYAMHPAPAGAPLKPVGEWNSTKIVVNGHHVEHWLNGNKILDFERWTDAWNELRLAGKWKDYPDWGKAASGPIALQDHGSAFWFRNVKLRPLP
jgi:hypothetical protein